MVKPGDYVSIDHFLFEGRGKIMEIFHGEFMPIQVMLDNGRIVRVVNDDIVEVLKSKEDE